jgi:hypothetical protein
MAIRPEVANVRGEILRENYVHTCHLDVFAVERGRERYPQVGDMEMNCIAPNEWRGDLGGIRSWPPAHAIQARDLVFPQATF